MPFVPHRVAWTREKVARFWDYIASRDSADKYFAAQAGDDVLRHVRKHVPLDGKRVVDFGSGPGFMTEKLLKRGARVHAVDTSPDSLAQVRRRVAGAAGFDGTTLVEGLPTKLPDSSFDGAIFLETIEHLEAHDLAASLDELGRLVRPGGFLVVTAPNEEDLSASTVQCPDCGCMFHAVQHVSSWSAASLGGALRRHGFEPVATIVTTFRAPSRVKPVLDLATRLGLGRPVNLLVVANRA